MSSSQFRRQTLALVAVMVLAAATFGATVAYGWSSASSNADNHRIIVHVDGNAQLTIAQAKRSECRAIRSSALDKARWRVLFDLASKKNATEADANAAGEAGKALPDIDVLTNKGGIVGGRRFLPCPKSIAQRPTTRPRAGVSTSRR